MKNPLACRQVFRPIVRVAPEDEILVGLKVRQHVRTAAERRFQVRLGKVFAFPVFGGINQHLRQNQRQFLVVAALLKIKAYVAGVQLFRPFHVGIINFVERRAFFHQTAVTENNVVGGDFRSVGKTGAFVKYKADIFVRVSSNFFAISG